jgi:glycerophosphoryl diester phosphodiesterase
MFSVRLLRILLVGMALTLSNFASTKGAEQLPDGWRIAVGSWRFADGAIFVDSMKGEARVTFGENSWQNYEIEVTATFLKVQNDSRWLAVVFRAAHDGSTPWSQFPIRLKTSDRSGSEFAVRKDKRWDVRLRVSASEDSKIGRPRRLRVVVQGSNVQGYLDGRLLVESPFCMDRAAGCVGLCVSGCMARFDDFNVRRLPDTSRALRQDPQPCEVIAHRGFSAVAPENTLVAIRKAIEAGASGCEFDVYAAKDGPVVLMHDSTVNRTTNGSGRVTELTVAELHRLDAGSWKDRRYAGESIPTLEEALSTLKGSGCQAVIEIKMDGISKRVVETVRAAGMLDQAAVIAFSPTVVKEVRALEPRLPCAWLSSEKLKGSPTERADWIAVRARQCNTNIVDLNYNMLSPEVLVELKKRGLIVWTWTVNDPVIMDSLMRWGIQSITTDRPDFAAKLSRQAAERQDGSSHIQR